MSQPTPAVVHAPTSASSESSKVSSAPKVNAIASLPLPVVVAPPKTYRIIVMGSGEVGKSAYVLRFIYQHYNPEFMPPSNTYSLTLGVDDRDCVIEVLDMQPGESREEFVELFREYMETAAGFVFLFDLTSLGTFEEAEFFREQLVSFRGAAPPIVLVGNKYDDFDYRQVSFEAGQGLGEYLGVPYVEVSAATGEGVEESMVQLIREIRRTEPPPLDPALVRVLLSLFLSFSSFGFFFFLHSTSGFFLCGWVVGVCR
jgi:small GTP-binding protein